MSLIATFLEKAGCIEGQVSCRWIVKILNYFNIPLQTPSAEGVITEDRREILTNCACFMAAFLKWDLFTFEKGLVSSNSCTLQKGSHTQIMFGYESTGFKRVSYPDHVWV